MVGYISEDGLKELLNYKYVSGGYSIGDRLLTPFWEWFVSFIPMTVAPNLLTLSALFWNWSAVALLMYYDQGKLSDDVPTWVLYYSAFCLFMYQTLDACDGKQARRTKTSGPLGQLFDHGCDSVNTLFGNYLYACAIQVGSSYHFFITIACTCLLFHAQQWEEGVTHVMRTNIGFFGVTEGQLLAMGMVIVAGMTNQKIDEWYLIDFVPQEKVPEKLWKFTIIDCVHTFLFLQAIIYASVIMFNTMRKVNNFVNYMEALYKLSTLLLWLLSIFMTFGYTKWAWDHPGYTYILFFPAFCRACCDQIVCNFTKE